MPAVNKWLGRGAAFAVGIGLAAVLAVLSKWAAFHPDPKALFGAFAVGCLTAWAVQAVFRRRRGRR